MSKRKKASSSFILELGLVVSQSQEKDLLVRFDLARQLYNACLGEALRRLNLMRESKAYQKARAMPKSKERTQCFKDLNTAFGFSDYEIQAYGTACKNACCFKDHLDVHVCQKIATRAFNAVREYAFGKRGRPRFKGKNHLDSVEGKNNQSGIRWREDRVKWSGLVLPARFDPKDKHSVQVYGLEHKVKFVRIMRRRIKGKTRFFVQLVLEGKPRQKHEAGNETVGLDLGPSTIACVGETDAFLDGFCSELLPIQREIRKIQRKMDRSRRAMNPDNYNPDGTIKPGKKTWKFSARYLADRDRLSEMHRRLAGTRKRLHGEMANRVLSMGAVIKTEDVSYKAWQRMFGKSVGFRAPGMFVEILCRKAGNAGGKVNKLPLSNALSQICHNCGAVQKKPLSTRWHRCDCGITAQRDLYSAFLARNVSGSGLDTRQAQKSWPGAEPLLRCAVSRLSQSANGGFFPSSFGISGVRADRTPKAVKPNVEAGDDVPVTHQRCECRREPRRDMRRFR